jgi:Superinfection immunity protein
MPHSVVVHSSLSTPEIAVVLGGLVLVYLLPLIIAIARRHRRAGWLAALNLLLGWTAIFWVVSLVWAVLPGQRRRVLAPALERT